ncbi:DUF6913 domain-containing protein [Psychroflexus sp. ALD_RP9]|uniref:DUF6913 domain-containing protein n=1 Tax=Psychroflexus sp. ALD_RP9 TaxID=2777186 RepID=UPI001A8DB6CB|nr:hypothetical protein [Psychroflexus sp. ALD_RP9]QSS96785.1 hypothetical protein IMZ30_10080 [Psychroflexus sp. ALD_RP9]
MRKTIRQFFISRKIKSNSSLNRIQKLNHNRAIILFHVEHTNFKQLKQSFKKYFVDSKNFKLHLIGFGSEKSIAVLREKSTENLQFISPKDFNLLANLKTESLQKCLNQPYHFCFNFYPSNVSYLQLINSMISAHFNIGVTEGYPNKFSVSVPESEPDQFFKEVSNYISKITYV